MLQTMKSRRELAAPRTPGRSALSSKGLCYPTLATAAAAHEELGLLFHCVRPASGEQAVTFIFPIPCRSFSVNTIVRRDPCGDKAGRHRPV